MKPWPKWKDQFGVPMPPTEEEFNKQRTPIGIVQTSTYITRPVPTVVARIQEAQRLTIHND